MNCCGNLSGVVAPFVTGILVSRTGSYMVPFALGALIMIPGILAYIFVVDRVVPPRARTSGLISSFTIAVLGLFRLVHDDAY